MFVLCAICGIRERREIGAPLGGFPTSVCECVCEEICERLCEDEVCVYMQFVICTIFCDS